VTLPTCASRGRGAKESLQEYTHKVVKLTSRGPRVSEDSIIVTIVGGLKVSTFQDLLGRVKPKSVQELFEIM
jgi:hypothetical protein